jgi:hypothetical protein
LAWKRGLNPLLERDDDIKPLLERDDDIKPTIKGFWNNRLISGTRSAEDLLTYFHKKVSTICKVFGGCMYCVVIMKNLSTYSKCVNFIYTFI